MHHLINTALTVSYFFFSTIFSAELRRIPAHNETPAFLPGYQTIQVTPGGKPDTLWNALCTSVPPGVKNLSVTTTTSWADTIKMWGTYKSIPAINNVQMKDGIVLTSGKAADCAGPNNSGSKTTEFGYPGDPDLAAVVGENVFDGSTLIINFTSDASIKGFSFDFCFGTEEYPEYVGHFNDAFICLMDGRNICLDNNGQYISANNGYFKVVNTPNPAINLQWDGFTTVLRTSKPLAPGNHTIKFAIGDTRDGKLDCGVFLNNFRFALEDTGTFPLVDLIKDQTLEVKEKSPAKTVVGKITNLFNGNGVALAIMNSVPEFTIDTQNFTILVADGADLDFDKQKQYSLSVCASVQLSNRVTYDTAIMTVNILEDSSTGIIGMNRKKYSSAPVAGGFPVFDVKGRIIFRAGPAVHGAKGFLNSIDIPGFPAVSHRLYLIAAQGDNQKRVIKYIKR